MKLFSILILSIFTAGCLNHSESKVCNLESKLIKGLIDFYEGETSSFFSLLTENSLQSIPNYFMQRKRIELHSDSVVIKFIEKINVSNDSYQLKINQLY